jgi:hypothetical protein
MMALDEISEMCEDLCFYLNELGPDESKELVKGYFGKYLTPTKGMKPFHHICPNCRSDDLEFDIIEPYDQLMKQHVDCKKCGVGFLIWSNTEWEYSEEDMDDDIEEKIAKEERELGFEDEDRYNPGGV